ncbi:hypothetical protein RJ639_016213 [Escallonia herrerae]|uniref:Uncharacterized protein n=1 Tax=Escallonia herrerae TaxID=1293975 RepID=A0AA88VDV9_9ASTE|nr:hypothetical protein RJ639_016213 [Escallonia herrerae]
MVHSVDDANETCPFGTFTLVEFYVCHLVTHSSHYITNSTGLRLFTQSWTSLPATQISALSPSFMATPASPAARRAHRRPPRQVRSKHCPNKRSAK